MLAMSDYPFDTTAGTRPARMWRERCSRSAALGTRSVCAEVLISAAALSTHRAALTIRSPLMTTTAFAIGGRAVPSRPTSGGAEHLVLAAHDRRVYGHTRRFAGELTGALVALFSKLRRFASWP